MVALNFRSSGARELSLHGMAHLEGRCQEVGALSTHFEELVQAQRGPFGEIEGLVDPRTTSLQLLLLELSRHGKVRGEDVDEFTFFDGSTPILIVEHEGKFHLL